ncbi:substrate-binding periplasmic protein [Burkholderiaceae bacterium UC74_6]
MNFKVGVAALGLAGLGLLVSAAPAQAASTGTAAHELTVAAPAFWCPFSCTAGSRHEGFTLDILRAVFEPRGIQVRLINENYARALQDVRDGHYGATPSTFKQEAPGFVFPKTPISRNQYCFYTAPGQRWSYAGIGSLKGQRVGIVKGYSYGGRLDQAIAAKAAQFDVSVGDDITHRMARMVMSQRLDSFVEDESLVQYILSSHPELQLRNAGCEPARYAYLALSPARAESAALAKAFDEGLQRLRAGGQLEQIMQHYGLHDRPEH